MQGRKLQLQRIDTEQASKNLLSWVQPVLLELKLKEEMKA